MGGEVKRERHAMPDYFRLALEQRGLMPDYQARPAYQRNDYIGWIERAKRPRTREKRLRQMLQELKQGGVYMSMRHAASEKH